MGLVDCLPEIESGVALILSLIESLVYPMNQEFSDLTVNQATQIGLHMFLHHQATYLMRGLVRLKSGDVVFGSKLNPGWVAGLLGLFLAGVLTLYVAFLGAGSAGP